MDYKTDNRWSPGGSGATVPENAPAAYAARWIDLGDLVPADIVPDRQGFAYNNETDRQTLIDLMLLHDLRERHQLLPYDESDCVAEQEHPALRPQWQAWMRRAGGYVYVDAWLTPTT